MFQRVALLAGVLSVASCQPQTPAPISVEPALPPHVEPVPQEPAEATSVELKADEFYAAAAPSVVLVTNPDANSMGSGVEIERGIFVTNCHVLAGGSRFTIQRDGRTVPAFLYRTAPDRDTCLLMARDSESHPAPTRSATTLRVGEGVFALGNPQGLELTLSEGIVSQLRGTKSKEPLVQTTAAISQGSSGGGLFDKAGNLIGISTFMHKHGQNLNFAVPIDWAVQLSKTDAPPDALASQTDEFSAAATDEPATDDPRELNQQGIALIREGRSTDAVAVLGRAANLAPADAEILGNLGYALLLDEEFEKSKDVLKVALQVAPRRAATWLNLGQAYSELGDEDLALRSVLNGYELATRKEAIRQGLATASQNPDASQRWRTTAATALSQIEASPAP